MRFFFLILAVLLGCAKAEADIVNVSLQRTLGSSVIVDVQGQLDTIADTFTITSWTEPDFDVSGFHLNALEIPITLVPRDTTGAAWDVADTFNESDFIFDILSNGRGFVSLDSNFALDWVEGVPDIGQSNTHFGWGIGLLDGTTFQNGAVTDFISVPSSASSFGNLPFNAPVFTVAAASVPEPGSLLLLSFITLGLAMRRYRCD